jgi:hypothetical protein
MPYVVREGDLEECRLGAVGLQAGETQSLGHQCGGIERLIERLPRLREVELVNQVSECAG